ncbi:hypothetical protein EG240_08790 [Paenimyroides tangerinum]|uniref:Uncharacterized protein n=1 Tax=Paenimyroides tangerinum TaxID=2488728 RepID=A0A3P3W7C4_9FLAO|nr:hypothetical protein [Paenimyroides tangerinum]RRJ90338.1 hypothetical protein EG240_08790 [Paenimyroides tangerinum]
MMFSALACVAFAFSEVFETKDLNLKIIETIENDDPFVPVYKVICTVYVHLTDWFGREYTVVESKTFWFETEISGNLKCDAFAGEMAKKHNISYKQPNVISPN